jgi:hypothetical protein
VANVTSQRGRLVAPNLDDRTWDDLVRQARDLIPRYMPQWTDHNPSDLGITLIELFAFLVEGLTYRLNQVPERNYIAFLNLLGITRDPETPAKVYLTFIAQPGRKVEVPEGTQAQTEGSETESPVVFETDRALTVLPIALKDAALIDLKAGTYRNASALFSRPPAPGGKLTIEPAGTIMLVLGFDGASAEPLELEWQFSSPLIPDPKVTVSWKYSAGPLPPATWPDAIADGRAAALAHDGPVRLKLPTGGAAWSPQKPSWGTFEGDSPMPDQRHWIGVQIKNDSTKPANVAIERILFNAVSAHAALTVAAPEKVGRGDGTAFQVFPLLNRPLFRIPESDDPYRHLQVHVDDKLWTRVDELPPADDTVYRVDAVTGDISFGNFDPTRKKGRGRMPPAGSEITARYRYVAGGLRTNVGPERVNGLRIPVDGIVGVTNLAPSFGASDEEPIEDTMRRAPELFKVRDRAVTGDDYEYLAREASTDVAIVRCLTPRRHETDNRPTWNKDDPWQFAGLNRAPGNVVVIIVPQIARERMSDVGRPEPSRDLIDEVQRYLDARRLLTANVQVTGPRYLPIVVTVTGTVFGSAIRGGLVRDKSEVEQDIRAKLQRFFHPLFGGPGGRGWQVGQHVLVPDVFRAVTLPDQVGFISEVTLEPMKPPPYHDPVRDGGAFDDNKHRPFKLSALKTWVQLTDYELVCFERATVTLTIFEP